MPRTPKAYAAELRAGKWGDNVDLAVIAACYDLCIHCVTPQYLGRENEVVAVEAGAGKVHVWCVLAHNHYYPVSYGARTFTVDATAVAMWNAAVCALVVAIMPEPGMIERVVGVAGALLMFA